MTYSSGGLIQAADYNTFQTNFDAIWGTGSGDSGWGQPALTSVSNSGTTGVIASVAIANTAGVLTVTAGSYFIGQQIQISGTLTAGTINGTNNYTTPSIFYIITVASSTSITISLTPSGAAVASTVGTATPGGTFNVLSAQSLVTAKQWASLVNNLSAAGSQTSTTLTARTAPVAGAAISVLPNVATDITSVTTRRGYSAGTVTTTPTWTGDISKTTPTGALNSAWNIGFTTTVTFPSADQARYFWNAGGLVRVRMSKTGGDEILDPDWNNFVATVGDLYISGRVNNADQVIAGVTYSGLTRIGGSGTPSPFLTTTGWYQLTSSPANLFFLTSSVTNDSYILLYASASASTTLLLTTVWVQDGRDPGDEVNIDGGTATTSPFTSFGTAPAVLVNVITPSPFSGPLINTWGTPTVNGSVT